MDPFLKACEATGPLELDVEGRDPRQSGRQVFDQPFALVGRDPRSDLPLVHEQISLRHAYLQIIAGRVFCIDLGSRTGTRWREGRRRFGWLDRRQAIRIGPFRIRVKGGDRGGDERDAEAPSRASILGPDSPRSALLPEVNLHFPERPGGVPTPWRMNRVMVLVGTRDICKLRLTDSSVSSLHCCLVRTAVGPWVVDLLGRGGVIVNDRVVRSALLQEGDVMKVGRYEIGVRCGPPARAQLPGIEAPPAGTDLATRVGGFDPTRAWSLSLPSATPLPSSNLELLPFNSASTPAVEGMSDAALMPLLNQFGMMQQQMFDQFQQTMMMMAQMFATMHRDQADLIRSEFSRLNQLTEEIEAIRADLAKLQPAPAPPAPAPGAAAARPSPMTGARGVSDQGPQAAAGSPGPNPTDQPEPGAASSPEQSEYLLRLHQRLAAIQDERRSRWQKLLDLMPGFAREEPVP